MADIQDANIANIIFKFKTVFTPVNFVHMHGSSEFHLQINFFRQIHLLWILKWSMLVKVQSSVISTDQLKSIYNRPFKDSHSHPIHTCFPLIASN